MFPTIIFLRSMTCTWLTREAGVASIPLSSFYNEAVNYKVLRFCFAKNDDTLLKGAELLHKVIW